MYRTHWKKCRCGKVWCDNAADARRKAEAQQFVTGNHNPVDVYQCKKARRHGEEVWHWTKVGDTSECQCGRVNLGQSVADKEAHRVNRTRTGPLVARSFQCPFGSFHTIDYPAGKKFRWCHDCMEPAFPDERTANLVVRFKREQGDPEALAYQCENTSWHVAL